METRGHPVLKLWYQIEKKLHSAHFPKENNGRKLDVVALTELAKAKLHITSKAVFFPCDFGYETGIHFTLYVFARYFV